MKFLPFIKKIHTIKKLWLLAAVFIFTLHTAVAQLYFEAQVRPRIEWRNGYRTLPDASSSSAFFTSQRSRASLYYTGPKVNMKLSLQDVRIWGDEEQMKDLASMAMHEAWAEMQFSEHYLLKLGRQEVVYNNHRLLGNVDWVQQARSHDAAVFKIRHGGWEADLGGAFNQAEEKVHNTDYMLNNYKALGFLWLHKPVNEKLTISALAVSDGFQAQDSVGGVLFHHTYGSDITYKKDRMQLYGAFYRQSGTDISRRAIEAYMAVINVTYTTKPFKITLGSDYLSGTGEHDTRVRTFNTLYATNHMYFGFMDYFLNIPADTRNGGLEDAYLKVNYSANPTYSVSLDYHFFALAKAIPASDDPAATIKGYLGSEVDAVFTYKFSEDINITLGYSTLFASNAMQAIKGGDASAFSGWGWVMFNIQPKLILKELDTASQQK